MSEVAKKVVIDRKRKKLLIDGTEFSWTMDQSGPQVELHDELAIVTVPIFADKVEVIPECEACDLLDNAGTDLASAREDVRRAEEALANTRDRLAKHDLVHKVRW